jgi:site-specific recombinase XerD
MTIQVGIELFRTHQKSQAREKTRESYAYLLRNLETFFGETALEAIRAENIHQFLLTVTDGRARSSARLRCAQVKAFFNLMIEHGKITSNPCDDLDLQGTPLQGPGCGGPGGSRLQRFLETYSCLSVQSVCSVA